MRKYDVFTVRNETMYLPVFEWDEDKAEINMRKHGVSFDEAKTVFMDTESLLINDPDHSLYEDRFLLLGKTTSHKLLIVCHCYRCSDTIVRIISARKATRHEASMYYEREEL